jgi:hypothetical protein
MTNFHVIIDMSVSVVASGAYELTPVSLRSYPTTMCFTFPYPDWADISVNTIEKLINNQKFPSL